MIFQNCRHKLAHSDTFVFCASGSNFIFIVVKFMKFHTHVDVMKIYVFSTGMVNKLVDHIRGNF